MSEKQTFSSLKISEKLIEKLRETNITEPTAVQSQAIPLIIEGKSLLFQSETGTGKTYAYVLPLLTRLFTRTEASGGTPTPAEDTAKTPQIMIVAPTFELASQIKMQIKAVSDIKTALLIGGAPIKRQVESLKEKPAIIAGTPARLVELLKLKKIKTEGLKALVLDEADRLISPELRDFTLELVNSVKKQVQLIAASATITKTVQKLLSAPRIAPDGSTETEVQTLFLPPEDVLKKRITHLAVFAERRDKIDTLRKVLLAEKPSKALIFTGKLDQVENIVSKLKYKGIECYGLHAKTDKVERKSIIDRFRSGKIKILVTSDLASRGLDIPEISHVIQMDLPSNEDFFIHRAGRTARAGKTGTNLVIGDQYEMKNYAKIEKKLGLTVYPKVLFKGKLTAPVFSE